LFKRRSDETVGVRLQSLFWEARWGVARRIVKIPGVGRAFSFCSDRLFLRQFAPDLRRLHDTLSSTEFADRYWVRAGMLLGWAREGGLIAHDRDADFALLAQDVPRLLAAVPALRMAGFHPIQQFHNNQGQLTEVTFRRGFAKYEFFVLEPHGDMFRYFVYGWPPDNLFEIEKQVPRQRFVTFEFLGRTWLRPEDTERELEFMYGDWRTPKRQWNYLHDGHNVVDRRPWTNPGTAWTD